MTKGRSSVMVVVRIRCKARFRVMDRLRLRVIIGFRIWVRSRA
jgi:hypothetical protein